MGENVLTSYGSALLGGLLIGCSAVFLWITLGRTLGVSGIVGGLFLPSTCREAWRYWFLSGLIAGAFACQVASPFAFINLMPPHWSLLVASGLLVGVGTRLANGCTSGHGICGVARLSKRSIVATVTFIFFGALMVLLQRLLVSLS